MVEIWYLALSAVLSQVSSNECLKVHNVSSIGVLGLSIEIHRKILKNFSSSELLVQILRICYEALSSGPLPSLFNLWSQVYNDPPQGSCLNQLGMGPWYLVCSTA